MHENSFQKSKLFIKIQLFYLEKRKGKQCTGKQKSKAFEQFISTTWPKTARGQK